jgi:hypothetical protein
MNGVALFSAPDAATESRSLRTVNNSSDGLTILSERQLVFWQLT